MELGLYQTLSQSGIDTATTGIKMVLCPARPIDILRIGIIPTVVFTANAVINVRRKTTPGAALGTGDLLGTITVVNTGTPGGYTVGVVNFLDVNPLTDPGAKKARVYPGEQLAFEIATAAGAATTAQCFIDFQTRGLHKADRTSPYYAKLKDYTL